MEYVYILIAIVAALVWIGKQIATFFRWVARSVSGATPARPVPTASGRPVPTALGRPAATPPAGPRPNPPRRAAPSPDRSPQTPAAPTREASASFAPAAPSPAAPLLGSRDDLVRAVILMEALGPPVSRRRRPPHPPSE